MLLTGQPEAGVEVAQHVLVLARLPNVVHGVGHLLPLYPGQLLLLHRRERHVGGRVLGVGGRGLWAEKEAGLVMRCYKGRDEAVGRWGGAGERGGRKETGDTILGKFDNIILSDGYRWIVF